MRDKWSEVDWAEEFEELILKLRDKAAELIFLDGPNGPELQLVDPLGTAPGGRERLMFLLSSGTRR